MTTRIILVRHGQTEWNRIERFRGLVDVPLNDTGLAQAEAAGNRIAQEWQPVAVYSSPRSRAVKTAEAIARHFKLPVQIHPGLEDINFGDWQGLTREEAASRWPKQVDFWFDHPQMAHIPHGDTLKVVRNRLMQTVYELAERHPDQTIVLVGHTATNRIMLLGMLGLGNKDFWRLHQDPCAINVVQTQSREFNLVSLNDTCHLRSQGL
jgi:broad specificity phosphatase PhoE